MKKNVPVTIAKSISDSLCNLNYIKSLLSSKIFTRIDVALLYEAADAKRIYNNLSD